MEEVEKTFNIECNPMTWPIGSGARFRGVYHRGKKQLLLYEPQGFATKEAKAVAISDFNDPTILEYMDTEERDLLAEEVELLEGTLGPLDISAFLDAKQTPLMFGSARNNFGIHPFLEMFSEIAPGPPTCGTQGGHN